VTVPARIASLDPERWDAVYQTAHGLIFLQTIEGVSKLYRRVAGPGELWLDVGCGTGRLTMRLLDEKRQIVGLDDDTAMIDFARGASSGVTGVSFTRASVDALPFVDGSLDGITAASLLGCLPAPESFAAEVARVLRPGGSALVSVTNARSTLRSIDGLLSRWRRGGTKPPEAALPVRTYSAAAARLLFENAGLRVEAIHACGFFLLVRDRVLALPSAARRWGWRATSPASHRLGRNLVVLARK